jgi:thiol-disulfide isomerase/thioredoxin
MRTFLLAAAFAAVLAFSGGRADDKKDPAGRPEQLEQIQKDLQKAFPEIVKGYRDAKTDADREKALEKLQPFGDRAVKLIEANPKDETSLKAGLFYLQSIGSAPGKGFGPMTGKVLKSLAENHMESKELGTALQIAAQIEGEESAAFLKAVAEKSKDESTKGRAILALADAAGNKADSPKATKEERAAAEKKAREYYERIAKDFADVAGPRGKKLGEQAKDGLYKLDKLTVGKQAPDAAGENLEGKKMKLSDFKGKVVVVDIWATWCGPCRAMIPHEREMVEKLKDKPFVLLSVSADAKKETLTEFLDKEKMPWQHWWNGPKGGVMDDFKIEHFPTIYVLDAKGVIRHKEIRGDELEKAVEELIKEAEKK